MITQNTISNPIQETPERIIKFIEGQTNLTIATCMDNIPYCASCFYAFDKEKMTLIFKSKATTRHIREGIQNKNISGSILPDRLIKMHLQGMQFTGIFLKPGVDEYKQASKIYYFRYPFATAIAGELWLLELNYIKMTDNQFGIGNKLEWFRDKKFEEKTDTR